MIISADNILKNFIGNKNTAINLINSLHKSSYNGAWILRGLKGIGKAKLAENIIIELYKIKNRKGDLIHPDLFTLDNKKTDKKFISVEEVRKVPSFLSKTSINSSYKTILIDSLNSLNNFGHNALLKTLENQNSNTIFFLIDHMNSYIPNTIKSRCKTVLFK